jgi:hypothetical protein
MVACKYHRVANRQIFNTGYIDFFEEKIGRKPEPKPKERMDYVFHYTVLCSNPL